MAEPLFVDTSRLEAAGEVLGRTSLPSAPPPVAASGTDRVSTAINEVMPHIEGPVADALPAVAAALARTAANVAAAAGIYAQADRALGQRVGTAEFSSAERDRVVAQTSSSESASPTASVVRTLVTAVADDVTDDVTDTASTLVTPLQQIGGLTTTVTSTVQGIISGVQSAGLGGVPKTVPREQESDSEDVPPETDLDEAGAAAGSQSDLATAAPVDLHAAPQTSPAGASAQR